MGEFYRKWRKIFLAIFVGNLLLVVVQSAFAYGHILKHEWGLLAVSVFFVMINGWCTVDQYKHWQRVKREEKEFMWRTLSTPGERLR